MCPCCCCYWRNGQLDVCTGRCCSAKETVFGSLPNFCCPEKRSGMNRIGHPDWVKLCVELNCAPNQNAFCYKLLYSLKGHLAEYQRRLAETRSNITTLCKRIKLLLFSIPTGIENTLSEFSPAL